MTIKPKTGRTVRRSPAAALLLLACAIALTGPTARAETAGISVTGVGEVRVVPDLARVTLEARREGTDAVALKNELDEVTRGVLALTRELDIEPRDVTAAAVNIYPRYRHRDGESIVDGLIATRSIEVTVRRLDQIGDFINRALGQGVNGIGGVALDAADRPELERAALDLAIDDARASARRIAERFGVGLGALLEAGTAASAPSPKFMDAMAVRSEAAGSFAPGELTIRREIQARYAIEPPAAR